MQKSITKELWQCEDKKLIELLICRKGGRTTIEIVDEILTQPLNKNQIAKNIKKDYHTVRYHLTIMCKHKYIVKEPIGKTYYYWPSKKLINNIDTYNKIKESFDEEK
ncbi:winged helix-turn-helix domain-containing protein [uncultured Methanobrevibacter sp.]|uniref:winged helix-turn-helix domain-containing protein n=1 Tax=uncultured Methanobrevibacter sp. TaxID=253161 RepID=UPI0025D9970A|nr:winged helix-turn-helix domain-containing protein [uncultured Methanobrevibacter sp.]